MAEKKKKTTKEKLTKKKKAISQEAPAVEAKVEAKPEESVEEGLKPPVEEKKQIIPPVKETPREVKIGEVRYQGTGRRKTAVAKVVLTPGEGKIVINDRSLREYVCGRAKLEVIAEQPLILTDTLKSYNVIASIFGGGVASQTEALRHGIARALLEINPDWKTLLKKAGFLRRDPRMKERKKYGHKRARKSFQYSKR